MNPTKYPEINVILNKLLVETKGIFREKLVGIYLGGSLAYGDFNIETSDVDIVAVVSDIPETLFVEIKNLVGNLLPANSKLRKRFEGLVMTTDQFKKLDPQDSVILSFNLDDKFTTDKQDTDSIIQRYIIAKNPVILAGPDPKDLIEPITQEDLKKATLFDLENWWKPKLNNPNFAVKRDYQAYAVLTMCRILYTLENGDIVSKPVAASWAMNTLDPVWKGLIERSLNWGENDGINDRYDVTRFVKYTLEKAYHR